jgi:ABC-type multidrug transport system permease subunit
MPLTWAVLLMRGVFVKGVGFSGIIPELAVLAIFAAVIFGIALLATRRRLSE